MTGIVYPQVINAQSLDILKCLLDNHLFHDFHFFGYTGSAFTPLQIIIIIFIR